MINCKNNLFLVINSRQVLTFASWDWRELWATRRLSVRLQMVWNVCSDWSASRWVLLYPFCTEKAAKAWWLRMPVNYWLYQQNSNMACNYACALYKYLSPWINQVLDKVSIRFWLLKKKKRIALTPLIKNKEYGIPIKIQNKSATNKSWLFCLINLCVTIKKKKNCTAQR